MKGIGSSWNVKGGALFYMCFSGLSFEYKIPFFSIAVFAFSLGKILKNSVEGASVIYTMTSEQVYDSSHRCALADQYHIIAPYLHLETAEINIES